MNRDVSITVPVDSNYYRAFLDPTGPFLDDDAEKLVAAMLDGKLAWPAYVHVVAGSLHTEEHPLSASSELQGSLSRLVVAASAAITEGGSVHPIERALPRLIVALEEAEALLTKLTAMQFNPCKHRETAAYFDNQKYCLACGAILV